MDDLLFLSHRIPYPPNKGDKIRSWHMLRHLARRNRVHLGCFVDDPDDWRHLPKLEGVCASVHALPLVPRRAKLRALRGLATGEPLTVPYFGDRRMAGWVQERLAAGVDRVFVFSSSMAPYVLGRRDRLGRLVVDLVDVDSEKWRQYAHETANPAARLIYRREGRRLLELERRVASVADAALLVSEQEAALFRRLAPDCGERVLTVRNGVDAAFFSPGSIDASPFPAGAKIAVFTGAMDYRPNVDAVTWFARDVFPVLRRRDPDWQFWIVGANPTEDVRRLGDGKTVRVTGRVPDIRPYLAQATTSVAPLRVARGIQNKVLEAMAMARPVVVTPAALEGIDAEPGQHLLVAEEPDAFADAILLAGTDRGRVIGLDARALIEERYGWDAALTPLDQFLVESVEEAAPSRQPIASLVT